MTLSAGHASSAPTPGHRPAPPDHPTRRDTARRTPPGGPGLLIALYLMAGSARLNAQNPSEPPIRYQVGFTYSPAEGLGHVKDLCRRDPSDIIRCGDEYFIWYSRIRRDQARPGRHGYNSGYQATVWYALSRDQGHHWKEIGQAIGKGPAGAFDCTGVFTPNIVTWKGRYYLFYTAVGPGFDNGPYEDRNRTAIGAAVADSPHGPWKKLPGNPLLRSSRHPQRFDSYRVDDSCFIIRQARLWMYYKGRQWLNTPANTKMGLAVADRPEGPFTRLNDGRCVQDSGHEVMVWPWQGGVMSLVSRHGPHGQSLQFAPDGLTFRTVARLPDNYPRAPGLFRADLSNPNGPVEPLWGISMAVQQADPYLVRFQIHLEAVNP